MQQRLWLIPLCLGYITISQASERTLNGKSEENKSDNLQTYTEDECHKKIYGPILADFFGADKHKEVPSGLRVRINKLVQSGSSSTITVKNNKQVITVTGVFAGPKKALTEHKSLNALVATVSQNLKNIRQHVDQCSAPDDCKCPDRELQKVKAFIDHPINIKHNETRIHNNLTVKYGEAEIDCDSTAAAAIFIFNLTLEQYTQSFKDFCAKNGFKRNKLHNKLLK